MIDAPDGVAPRGVMHSGGRLLMILTLPELWAGAALVFSILSNLQPADGRSRLWFLDQALLAGFLLSLWAYRRGWLPVRLRPSRFWPAFAFVGSAWLTGMLYELSLSGGDGHSVGGFHPQTNLSFLLAQGQYVPLALFGLAVVRRYRCSIRAMFFMAGAMSMYEMLSAGMLSSLASLHLLVFALFMVAYYVTVYAMFLCWPFLLIGPAPGQVAGLRELSWRRSLTYGLLGGLFIWVLFVLWSWLLDSLGLPVM